MSILVFFQLSSFSFYCMASWIVLTKASLMESHWKNCASGALHLVPVKPQFYLYCFTLFMATLYKLKRNLLVRALSLPLSGSQWQNDGTGFWGSMGCGLPKENAQCKILQYQECRKGSHGLEYMFTCTKSQHWLFISVGRILRFKWPGREMS